jgi:hypothetical protein
MSWIKYTAGTAANTDWITAGDSWAVWTQQAQRLASEHPAKTKRKPEPETPLEWLDRRVKEVCERAFAEAVT